MDGFKGGPRPDSTRPGKTGRQLTIGECIAVARYGTSEADERSIDLDALLLLIDRLEVCTTCGWSRSMHVAVSHPEHVEGLCAHWTREM